jgi:hypothetical protein
MDPQTPPLANIGPAEIRKRLWPGCVLLVAGGIASFLTRSFFAQVVAFFGFLLVFQARDRVCVALADRGACNLDGTTRRLSDPETIDYFQKRARRIYLKSFLATLALLLVGRAYIYFLR